jgi:predicted Zn-dependent protease
VIYHFTTLNSAVENAFAVPGGYVYLTRQLMGIVNDGGTGLCRRPWTGPLPQAP